MLKHLDPKTKIRYLFTHFEIPDLIPRLAKINTDYIKNTAILTDIINYYSPPPRRPTIHKLTSINRTTFIFRTISK